MSSAVWFIEDKKGQVYTSPLNVGLSGRMFGGTLARAMKRIRKDSSISHRPALPGLPVMCRTGPAANGNGHTFHPFNPYFNPGIHRN